MTVTKKRNNNIPAGFKLPEILINNFKPYLWFIVIGFTVYFNSLNFRFVDYDDTDWIIKKYYYLKNPVNIIHTFSTDVFLSGTSSFYRPVLVISFLFDYQIAKDNPIFYHLVNIILHILVTSLLFHLLNRFSDKRLLNFLISFLFLIHPVSVQAVAWIPGRNDSLLALFIITGFLFFDSFLQSGKKLYFMIHLILFLLALFTKETAVLFPLVLISYMIFKNENRTSIKKYVFFLFHLIFILIFLFIRNSVLSVKNPILIDYKVISDSLIGFFGYSYKIVFPVFQTPVPYVDTFNIWLIILTNALILLLIVYSGIYLNKLFRFGIIWFVVFLIPTFIQVSEHSTFFEHRAYLPLAGVALILTQIKSSKKFVFPTIFCVISVFFIFRIFVYSPVFTNPRDFWGYIIKKSPDMTIGYNQYGKLKLKEGNKTEAVSFFRKALLLDSLDATANNNLGYIYKKSGNPDSAESFYQRALTKNKYFPEALNNLANIYIDKNKLFEAEQKINLAILINPAYFEAFNNLGIVYAKKGRYTTARIHFLKALDINPYFNEAYFNISFSYFKEGNIPEAGKYYKQARERGFIPNDIYERALGPNFK